MMAETISLDPPETFQRRVRIAMKNRLRGLPQEALAQAAGLTQPRISQIMNQKGNMTLATIEAVLIAAKKLSEQQTNTTAARGMG